MSRTGLLKYLYLAHFSKPASHRVLYRAIRRGRVQRIVELGIVDPQRTVHMIAVAGRYAKDAGEVSYTGIDMFEGRDDAPQGWSLKRAHQLLKPTGARIKLVPGQTYDAMARTANSLTGTDLVIISAGQDPSELQKAWFYFPRLLHEGSHVYCEQASSGSDDESVLERMSHDEINRLATASTHRKAA